MGKIEHVVVLMLENRSFDHVLGWLKRENPAIDGLDGSESNPTVVGSPLASRISVSDQADWAELLPFDPPHEFSDVTEQIFGTAAPAFGQRPSMDGFLQRAARVQSGRSSHVDLDVVMRGFAPGRLPAIHALAREFVVCDRWFASVPGPTFPNRFFAHCATAGGFLDGKVFRPYQMPSLFNRLEGADKDWRIYFHDLPQALTLARLVPLAFHFQFFDQFLSAARRGQLPDYAFIEPDFSDVNFLSHPSDQHPPSPMRAGDDLVRRVYEALRTSPQWPSTLLVVTWDEHGGFFDHVAPPAAVAPDSSPGQFGFRFDRLGVRVPALLISPLMQRGFVDHTPYEHASIPATVGKLFGLEPLTERDRHAATFDGLALLDVPRDTPRTLPTAPTPLPAPADERDIDRGPVRARASRRAKPASRGRIVVPRLTPLQLSLVQFAELVTKRAASDESPATEERLVRGEESARVQAAVARMGAFMKSAAGKGEFPSRGTPAAAPAAPVRRVRNVVPDKVDLRDRVYAPRISVAPPWRVAPPKRLHEPFDQGDTNACTGYALASVIDLLLTQPNGANGAGQPRRASKKGERVSPRMLYSMARRYDEFPGATADTGSSLRGVLKGWFRSGVCRFDLWDDTVPTQQLPEPQAKATEDWWRDAFRRPLGAYYRVETSSVPDLQAAIHEAGLVVVSACAHDGWSHVPTVAATHRPPDIPFPFPSDEPPGGHAFVLTGYDDEGFYVFNSWGKKWGAGGFARLSYADWLANKMDAWVVQLGVPTADHRDAAARTTLELKKTSRSSEVGTTVTSTVVLASDPIVAEQEISAFVLDADNHGRLSKSGRFRTQPDDVRFLLEHHLPQFRKQHGLAPDEPTPVAIYAHGGLVGEDAAAATARQWVPALYASGRFPIFIMWETGLCEVIGDILADKLERSRTAVGGGVRDFLDRRAEALAGPIGAPLWSKMKSNAAALTHDAAGLFRYLFEPRVTSSMLDPKSVRLELIGHSAGSIVQAELAAWLIGRGFPIERIVWMAPAIRVDRFDQLVRPHLGAEIRRFQQYSLTEGAEKADPTVPAYSKSLLYLVSHAFEGGIEVPILGMEKHFPLELRNAPPGQGIELILAPGSKSDARTHGGFSDDLTTRDGILHPDPVAATMAKKRTPIQRKTGARAPGKPKIPAHQRAKARPKETSNQAHANGRPSKPPHRKRGVSLA